MVKKSNQKGRSKILPCRDAGNPHSAHHSEWFVSQKQNYTTTPRKVLYFTRLGLWVFFLQNSNAKMAKAFISQITRLSRASFKSLQFELNFKIKKSSKGSYFGVKMLTPFLELENFL